MQVIIIQNKLMIKFTTNLSLTPNIVNIRCSGSKGAQMHASSCSVKGLQKIFEIIIFFKFIYKLNFKNEINNYSTSKA